ncbi:DUF1648 domain-containing protein [Pseudonocardia lacus]|uniref:DUF1648 domain-containing protein n=1 Tax=Pseudonocardia lacus TaxID=2835865 RepID=UPI001BDD7747|nr:DUF1648 domain-containing protein [Pseudonocardia lacus]
MSFRTPPTAIAPLVAIAPTIAILLTADLPDPLAVHFDLTGTADRFAGRGATALLGLAVAALLAVVFGLVERNAAGPPGRRGGPPDRTIAALGWGTAGLLGVVLTAATAVNIGATDARTVALPLWVLPCGLAVGVLVGALVARLSPPGSARGTVPADAPAPTRLRPTERVSWSRVSSAPWLRLGGVGLAVVGAAVAVAARPDTGIALIAVGLALLLVASARTTVDDRGLTVGIGPLGWPRIAVPIEDVASAGVTEVRPARFGGWGLRYVPGGRAVIVRAGPALVVTRRDGRQLTITVDDPQTAAALLNGLVERV